MEKSKNGMNQSALEKRIAEIRAMPKREFDEKFVVERKFLREVLARAKKQLSPAEYAEKKAVIEACLKENTAQKKRLLQFCGQLMEDIATVMQLSNDFVDNGERTVTVLFSYSKTPSKKKTEAPRMPKRRDADELDAIVQEAKYLKRTVDPKKSYACVLDALIDKRKETCPRFSNTTVWSMVGLSKTVYDRAKRDCATQKHNAWQIAIGLQCNMEEAAELLDSLGYSINLNIPFDAVMALAIQNELYNIYDVNEMLADAGVKLFSVGAVVKDGDSGAETPKRGRPPKVHDSRGR